VAGFGGGEARQQHLTGVLNGFFAGTRTFIANGFQKPTACRFG
jgi:hypothetical protein